MKLGIWICAALFVAFCGVSNAQEVKFIDLSAAPQRTELRHPPAPPSVCDSGGSCVAGGYLGVSIADGAPDVRDPHALGVYLLSVTPTDIRTGEPFNVEFKVLNTGLAPMELPVSPHLADLQPPDESASFSYLSLALVVRVEAENPSCAPCVGYVELYGIHDRDGSTVSLRPGESIRVQASITIPRRITGAARVRGEFWLRSNTFNPHPGGGGTTAMVNLYPNVTPTPSVPVQFVAASTR